MREEVDLQQLNIYLWMVLMHKENFDHPHDYINVALSAV